MSDIGGNIVSQFAMSGYKKNIEPRALWEGGHNLRKSRFLPRRLVLIDNTLQYEAIQNGSYIAILLRGGILVLSRPEFFDRRPYRGTVMSVSYAGFFVCHDPLFG